MKYRKNACINWICRIRDYGHTQFKLHKNPYDDVDTDLHYFGWLVCLSQCKTCMISYGFKQG